LAATRHPRLQVVLAIGWPAQIARASVNDLVRQTQSLENRFLDAEEFLVNGLALPRKAKGEHLDLRKLMNAVQSPGVTARRPRLRAEAMRKANIFEGQLLLLQDLVAVHAAQGNLGSGDQAQVGICNAVNLPFFR